jgi:hypothetical protein
MRTCVQEGGGGRIWGRKAAAGGSQGHVQPPAAKTSEPLLPPGAPTLMPAMWTCLIWGKRQILALPHDLSWMNHSHSQERAQGQALEGYSRWCVHSVLPCLLCPCLCPATCPPAPHVHSLSSPPSLLPLPHSTRSHLPMAYPCHPLPHPLLCCDGLTLPPPYSCLHKANGQSCAKTLPLRSSCSTPDLGSCNSRLLGGFFPERPRGTLA